MRGSIGFEKLAVLVAAEEHILMSNIRKIFTRYRTAMVSFSEDISA
jgi:hypothetical protein